MESLFEARHVVNSDLCGCPGCMGASIESDPASWDSWTDEDVWMITDPAPPVDDGKRLTLDELVERLAAFFDLDSYGDDNLDFVSWGSEAGRLIGEELRALAFKIRLVDANTPDEYRLRVDQLDEDARECWRAEGYIAGVAAGRAERRPIIFGHDA
jgi:hypothetical protein